MAQPNSKHTDNVSPDNIKGGVFRHYKTAQDYEVVGVALHTESEESLVIYRPLYESDHKLFARPYHMFVGEVEVDNEKVYRFQKIAQK